MARPYHLSNPGTESLLSPNMPSPAPASALTPFKANSELAVLPTVNSTHRPLAHNTLPATPGQALSPSPVQHMGHSRRTATLTAGTVQALMNTPLTKAPREHRANSHHGHSTGPSNTPTHLCTPGQALTWGAQSALPLSTGLNPENTVHAFEGDTARICVNAGRAHHAPKQASPQALRGPRIPRHIPRGSEHCTPRRTLASLSIPGRHDVQ